MVLECYFFVPVSRHRTLILHGSSYLHIHSRIEFWSNQPRKSIVFQFEAAGRLLAFSIAACMVLSARQRLYRSAFVGSESSYSCSQKRNQSTDNPWEAIRSTGFVITCSSAFIKSNSTGFLR